MFRNLIFARETRPIIVSVIALSLTGVLSAAFTEAQQNAVSGQPGIIMNIPGYPLVFELNKGDSMLIDRTFGNERVTRTLAVQDIRLFRENNNWIPDSLGTSDYYKTEVDILVAGKPYTVMLRPYQMPVLVDGLRIYVEGVKTMGAIPNLRPLGMDKDVRFSVCLEHEPWGIPADLEFLVNEYRTSFHDTLPHRS